jgi:hypothetical protein
MRDAIPSNNAFIGPDIKPYTNHIEKPKIKLAIIAK